MHMLSIKLVGLCWNLWDFEVFWGFWWCQQRFWTKIGISFTCKIYSAISCPNSVSFWGSSKQKGVSYMLSNIIIIKPEKQQQTMRVNCKLSFGLFDTKFSCLNFITFSGPSKQKESVSKSVFICYHLVPH